MCVQVKHHTLIFSTTDHAWRGVVQAHTDLHPPAVQTAPSHNVFLECTGRFVAKGRCLIQLVNSYAMALSTSTHQQNHVQSALKAPSVPHSPCAANAMWTNALKEAPEPSA